jgi:hypothetical protein
MLSQKDGIYNAVVSFHKDHGRSFEDGTEVVFSKEDRATVIGMVCEAFHADEISISEAAKSKFSDPAELKSYAGSLLSNWLRKDTRLNGGVKYSPKNPGSRAGQSDETIKNLRLLRKTLDDADQIASVDEEISTRLAAIKAAKAPTVEVNYDAIPAALREKLGV